MHGSDEGFKPKHEKTKYFSCRRCRTLDLNDFRFLCNFIEPNIYEYEYEYNPGIIFQTVTHAQCFSLMEGGSKISGNHMDV